MGRIPDLEFYDPDGMMAKKKEELTRWKADQVRRNVSFHFHQEMIDYCNEPAVSQFLRSFDLVAPLEPREAFFGGRTGAMALHAVAGEGEEIRYVDITSLYPWVNKNCPYPIGHPQIIT